MLQAQCDVKAQHKLVVAAMRWYTLVRASSERLDNLVMSAMRRYAVVRRTPCSLANYHVKLLREGHAEVILVR